MSNTSCENEILIPINIDALRPEGKIDGYPTNFPKRIRKFLEIIPGLITWFMILSPITFTLIGIPQILVYYVSFLVIFWTMRGVQFALGLFIGYLRGKKEMDTDWLKLINDDPQLKKQFDDLKYLYICPVYKEPLDAFEKSIDSYATQDIDPKKISVIFAYEEKAFDLQKDNFEYLKNKYGEKFGYFGYFVHPTGIPDEVTGVKGANINWACRNFVKKLEKDGEDLSKYLLTTSDCDQAIHPKYLSAITYKYLINEKPLRTFFSSAIHTFNNNVYRVPLFCRIHSIMLTLAIFQDWIWHKKRRETFSSYVVNLKTVHDVGYWPPDVGIDDTTFYWNALVYFNGDFRGEEVYIPTYNDAVENETTTKTYQSLYKQQHRWGWGIIIFPTTIANVLKSKCMTIWTKLKIISMLLFSPNMLLFTTIYLITFTLPILNLISPQYNYSSYSYNLPKVISYILTGLMTINFSTIIIRHKISPIPREWSLWRRFRDIIENLLITVGYLFFGFTPYVQAQTEMMLGKGLRKNYYATEKQKMTR